MKIIIVGGGVVGTNLAREFLREDHEVCLIDNNPQTVRTLSEKMDILILYGSGTSQAILKEVGVQGADMFIGVTNSDEVNIMACTIARAFGARRTIARVRNTDYTEAQSKVNLRDLGVDLVVNPLQILVNSIVDIIKLPGATEMAEFADGKVLLRGFKITRHAPIVGKKIMELKQYYADEQFLITAILRGNLLRIPSGQTQIRANDTLFIIASDVTFSFVQNMLTGRKEVVRKAIIYGATPIAINLAKILEEFLENIVIIEPVKEDAEKAASVLSKTIVLNANAKDPEVLNEAGIQDANFFIALSADDEDNMLSSLLAKEHGAAHTAAITLNPDYVPLLEAIGIDVVFNPRVITISKILKFIRQARIISAVRLHESDAEVIELEAQDRSKVVGKKLKDLDFPDGAVVAAILREGSMIIPHGESSISPKDKVIVFSESKSIPFVEKLFTGN